MNDVLLCLGTDIASDAPEEVVTTVNQCLFKGEMVVGKEEGTTSVYRENVSVKNPAWVYHDKVGYLFPSGGDVIVSNPKQTGAWKDINISGSGKKISADIFNLWISHGVKAKEGKIAYMVVPDKSLEEFRTVTATQNYKIIQNSSVVQAVKLNQQYAIVFYHPGTIDLGEGLTLATDKQVIVYLEQKGTGYEICVADPL